MIAWRLVGGSCDIVGLNSRQVPTPLNSTAFLALFLHSVDRIRGDRQIIVSSTWHSLLSQRVVGRGEVSFHAVTYLEMRAWWKWSISFRAWVSGSYTPSLQPEGSQLIRRSHVCFNKISLQLLFTCIGCGGGKGNHCSNASAPPPKYNSRSKAISQQSCSPAATHE